MNDSAVGELDDVSVVGVVDGDDVEAGAGYPLQEDVVDKAGST